MSFPYKVFSHYSIQQAFAKVDDIVETAVKNNLPAIALTDINSVAGAVDFIKSIKKANEAGQKIKGILGITLLVEHGGILGYVTYLCRNKDGWYELLKMLSNTKEYSTERTEFYITSANLIESKNLFLILGGCDSLLHNLWKVNERTADDFLSIRNHEFVKLSIESEVVIPDFNRWLESKYMYRVECDPVYYTKEEDFIYQQIITCSKHKKTFSDIDELCESDLNRLLLKHNISYIKDSYSPNNNFLLDECESFDIKNSPQIPTCIVDGQPVTDADSYLTDLCRSGWLDRQLNVKTKGNAPLRDIYIKRIKYELDVFKESRLSNYMLIVREFINHAKDNNIEVGLRGSAAGCLVSYLIGLSDVDPVIPDPTLPYSPARELLFERFYCAGRNQPGHISLPDCDIDVAISFRKKLIEFIRERYGESRVCNIITFGRMDGRGVIKEVFRILEPENNSFSLANAITERMVDTAKVQDLLEDKKAENPSYNVINYCIDNIKAIAEYAKEYPKEFEIAIKLTNTIRNQGKHAAGIVVSDKLLEECFPICYDSDTKDKIIQFEMEDAEYVGAIKFDILGVAALEKIGVICHMINQGLTEPVCLEE